MRFIRTVPYENYIEDQTVTIGMGGGSDTVEDIPLAPNAGLEIELDDGSVFVILGYRRKN